MTASPASRASFLDPTVLARIDNLELLARTVVDGFLQGIHRSPYLGVSMDFAEHRPYMPGDDIRRIDWRLYARTDRFHIKQFEAETNADVGFLLDVSASMGYGSGETSKLDYGRFLTASLAYFSAGQKDRVGLYAFDDDVVGARPALGGAPGQGPLRRGPGEGGTGGKLGTSRLRESQTPFGGAAFWS